MSILAEGVGHAPVPGIPGKVGLRGMRHIESTQPGFPARGVIDPLNDVRIPGRGLGDRPGKLGAPLGRHPMSGLGNEQGRDAQPVILDDVFLKLVVEQSSLFRRIFFARFLDSADTVYQPRPDVVRKHQVIVFIEFDSQAGAEYPHLGYFLLNCHSGEQILYTRFDGRIFLPV